MKLRAVICDVYLTVLDVEPPPEDADRRWAALWQEQLGRAPRLSLEEFDARADGVVEREHAAARAAGIAYPEVYWPAVVRAIVPEVAALDAAGQAEFGFRQTALWHTVRLMPGAVAALRGLRERGIHLGIASNAQPYTLRELEEALAGAGASSSWFDPALCFWSFAHGFSKPDPHVFRLLTARLHGLGITPHETLMVGDRVDNDLAPARAQGWRTWRLGRGEGVESGDWAQLAAMLAAAK